MPLLFPLQSSAGSVLVIKRKDFAAFIECDRALFQIDRGRFRHRATEFTKLRTHFFHLLFQMVLVNRAHLLGIFCLKQPLCELEPSIHICFGKRYCLFVQLLCSRVSSSHTSVGLLTQFLGLSHYFDTASFALSRVVCAISRIFSVCSLIFSLMALSLGCSLPDVTNAKPEFVARRFPIWQKPALVIARRCPGLDCRFADLF